MNVRLLVSIEECEKKRTSNYCPCSHHSCQRKKKKRERERERGERLRRVRGEGGEFQEKTYRIFFAFNFSNSPSLSCRPLTLLISEVNWSRLRKSEIRTIRMLMSMFTYTGSQTLLINANHASCVVKSFTISACSWFEYNSKNLD